MQATYEVPQLTRPTTYRVADQLIAVEAQDSWANQVIEKYFAGWYLTAEDQLSEEPAALAIVIRSKATPPRLPQDWQHFEIAGGGTCHTNGQISHITIEDSTVLIGAPGLAPVEVWINESSDVQSEGLTRAVTYALSTALRRRRLFELHSAALIDPETGKGLLIIGPSGSGKSTLTVQLASAGWSFLTDDVLLLSNEDDVVRAWPLRRCFAVTAETFAASCVLKTRTSLDYLKSQRDDKKQFVPHGVFADGFREHSVPKSLFFSRVSGAARSQVESLSPGETMTRLIRMSPWSCYDRTTAAAHLAALSALVRQSRAYSLLAGRDLLDSGTAANLVASYLRDQV